MSRQRSGLIFNRRNVQEFFMDFSTQPHTPAKLKPELQCCENLKTRPPLGLLYHSVSKIGDCLCLKVDAEMILMWNGSFKRADRTPSPIVPEDTNILVFRNVDV